MYENPFAELSLLQCYEGLMSGQLGPRWPDVKMQKGYAGTAGPQLVSRAFEFIDMMSRDGAFKRNWKGLDYGCGWGRFLSTMLSKGSFEQFDGCDAWQITLDLVRTLNYSNYIFKIPEILSAGDISSCFYDFIMAFSVFTHLSPEAFNNNVSKLLLSLKPGGTLYITVRHEEFINHKFSNRDVELTQNLRDNGCLFLNSAGTYLSEGVVFGDMIVTERYMSRFGNVRYLGFPHSLQHVYAIKR